MNGFGTRKWKGAEIGQLWSLKFRQGSETAEGLEEKTSRFQSDIKRIALEKLPFRSRTGRVFFRRSRIWSVSCQ